MEQRKVDVAIIGAGTAGLTARRTAKDAGASVLMIDPGPLGTTCARVGCMPSKLLIAAAEAAHTVREAGIFGLETTLKIDQRRVLERVQRERDRFVGFVLQGTDAAAACGELITGSAHFVDAHTLQVDDHTRVEAKAIIVATGTSVFVPPPFRNLGDRLLTNEEIFERETLPGRVLVAGAGVIGLELGQALARLGSEVTLVDLLTTVGPLRDPKTVAAARAAFSEEYALYLGYELERVKRQGEVIHVDFKDAEGRAHALEVDVVLGAAGRRPNVRGLDLDKAGIALDARGMPAYNPFTMQVGDSHVFLAGDVTGDRPVLHEAADEGRIAGSNAARFPEIEQESRSVPLGVVFTEPQLALVGKPYADIDNEAFRAGEVDYGNQGRARVMNLNKGLVRVYGEVATRKLVGAELVGPRAENTAHLLAWAVQQKMTVDDVLTMPFYHPVIEEGIRTALRGLKSALDQARA